MRRPASGCTAAYFCSGESSYERRGHGRAHLVTGRDSRQLSRSEARRSARGGRAEGDLRALGAWAAPSCARAARRAASRGRGAPCSDARVTAHSVAISRMSTWVAARISTRRELRVGRSEAHRPTWRPSTAGRDHGRALNMMRLRLSRRSRAVAAPLMQRDARASRRRSSLAHQLGMLEPLHPAAQRHFLARSDGCARRQQPA